jgi:DNA-directed RNA polymerase subunit L
MEIARCYLQNERGEPYSFDFTVESVGILDVPYIVQRACEVGEAMVARYANIEKGSLPDDVSVSPADARIIGFDFLFRNQDHTLGNLLQTYLEQNHMDATGDSTKITYVGYDIPHPLRDEMLLRIGVEDGQESTARKALGEACRSCMMLFREMREAWMRSIGVPSSTKPSVVSFRRKTPSVAMKSTK